MTSISTAWGRNRRFTAQEEEEEEEFHSPPGGGEGPRDLDLADLSGDKHNSRNSTGRRLRTSQSSPVVVFVSGIQTDDRRRPLLWTLESCCHAVVTRGALASLSPFLTATLRATVPAVLTVWVLFNGSNHAVKIWVFINTMIIAARYHVISAHVHQRY